LTNRALVASFRADHLASDNGFTTPVFSFVPCNNLDHLHGDAEKNALIDRKIPKKFIVTEKLAYITIGFAS
jgi:hypothetical protein